MACSVGAAFSGNLGADFPELPVLWALGTNVVSPERQVRYGVGFRERLIAEPNLTICCLTPRSCSCVELLKRITEFFPDLG